MPQFWPRYHWFASVCRPILSKIALRPVVRSPGAGFISQRQTMPAAMKEIAIGNR
jgi:hypothetical protein